MSALASAIITRAANNNDNATRPAAATTTGAIASRYDLYRLVHKGLRAALGEALGLLGRADPAVPLDFAGALNAVAEVLDLCAEHVAHENGFIHTAMERAQPGSATFTAAEHAHHLTAIAMLTARLSAARTAPEREQAAHGHQLYRLFALFVADNLQHMEVEESSNTEVLWQHYSDDELRALVQAIESQVPPARMLVWMRWILPNLTRAERLGLVAALREALPEAALAAILDRVRPHLSPSENAALAVDVG